MTQNSTTINDVDSLLDEFISQSNARSTKRTHDFRFMRVTANGVFPDEGAVCVSYDGTIALECCIMSSENGPTLTMQAAEMVALWEEALCTWVQDEPAIFSYDYGNEILSWGRARPESQFLTFCRIHTVFGQADVDIILEYQTISKLLEEMTSA